MVNMILISGAGFANLPRPFVLSDAVMLAQYLD